MRCGRLCSTLFERWADSKCKSFILRRFQYTQTANKEWDICIPDEKLDTAQAIFDNDIRFEQAVPPPLLSKSLRHIRTTFILKNVEFVFILVPASDHFVNLICYE